MQKTEFQNAVGVSIIYAMMLETVMTKSKIQIPVKGIIEFQGYMKNKINNKHLVIFSKAPKIIAHPNDVIGDPLEFEKREEQGDFTNEEVN